jgi:hypothetical protein
MLGEQDRQQREHHHLKLQVRRVDAVERRRDQAGEVAMFAWSQPSNGDDAPDGGRGVIQSVSDGTPERSLTTPQAWWSPHILGKPKNLAAQSATNSVLSNYHF